MSAPDQPVYLLHIRDRCEELLQCRELNEQGTVPKSILLNAVCRNLEIIGEASQKIAADYRLSHPEFPWREMKALRNVLIHNYEGADPDLDWAIVERDIPPLLETVRRLLHSDETTDTQ